MRLPLINRSFFILCLFSLASFVGHVATTNAVESNAIINDKETRLKVGLVLSGGGAKGAAHIGVLRVLEQNNVPIDYVVGTSIGAYVGGLYALGYSVNDIEKIMLTLPWDDGYSDFIPRQSLLFENKKLRDQYNISLRIGYSDGRFKMPQGFLLGQTVSQLLQQSTDLVSIFSDENGFDQLAVPFRAVASDLVTAKPVVLSSGSISQAMKASAAVPGIVAAVNIDGRLLVDGGITNNMPIDVIKAMGAERIIAVDIGSPLTEKSELDSAISVINQLSTILTNNTSLQQKKLLSEQDILLRPAIDDLSTTDFSIMGKALLLGEQVALDNLAEIQTLSVDDVSYQEYLQQKTTKASLWLSAIFLPIVEIQYKNNSKVSEIIIAEHFNVKVGTVINQAELRLAIDRVYALDKFEQVNAEFTDGPTGRKLILTTEEKSWGPNYLNFGFSLKSDFSNNTIMAINAGYELNDVTENGGLWLNEIQLGWEPMVASEFYQPLTKQQEYYFRTRAEYAQDKWEDTKDRPEATNKYAYGAVALGFNYDDNGIFETGLSAEKGNLSFDNEHSSEYGYRYRSLGGYATFAYDSLDSINFPTQGNKFNVDVFLHNDVYDAVYTDDSSKNSTEIKVNWRGAFGFRGHTFVGISSFATVITEEGRDSDLTVHVSELGGFLNLSGYQQDALIGAHKAFVAVVYQYDLGREVPGGLGLPIYLGTSLEAGNTWTIKQSVKFDDLISSGSLYLGTDTSFGPAVLGVGFASGGEYTVFLSLGKNW